MPSSLQGQSFLLSSSLYDNLLSARIHVIGKYIIECLMGRATLNCDSPINSALKLPRRVVDDKAQFFFDPSVDLLNFAPALRVVRGANNVLYPMPPEILGHNV